MSFVIKELDTTYVLCDRVHAMLMRQSACLVVYPITVHNFNLNCTSAGHASDEMKVPA